MYKEAANKLKQNTEIMETVFRKYNLKISGFNVKPDDEGGVNYLIELTGGQLKDAVQVKVNLYDADNTICAMESMVIGEDFSGYDTISIYFSDGILDEAVKARVFPAPF